ncbi:predicted protein [Coccidioides posadasii str. Silveira]|uniref:Predicted protein n=2 Tax=Coccidioides posadasii TaxID=199306 RepID=E9D1Y3_COCPS|nr:predicted protein [Coccidioides posadasii str. Silveira]
MWGDWVWVTEALNVGRELFLGGLAREICGPGQQQDADPSRDTQVIMWARWLVRGCWVGWLWAEGLASARRFLTPRTSRNGCADANRNCLRVQQPSSHTQKREFQPSSIKVRDVECE